MSVDSFKSVRCPSYRGIHLVDSIIYCSRMTEKRQGPTPGVCLWELSILEVPIWGGGGGIPHMKVVGMFVVSLRGVNFGFWSPLGCSG